MYNLNVLFVHPAPFPELKYANTKESKNILCEFV